MAELKEGFDQARRLQAGMPMAVQEDTILLMRDDAEFPAEYVTDKAIVLTENNVTGVWEVKKARNAGLTVVDLRHTV